MPYDSVFQADIFQTAPLVFQIDKPREDEDKDKENAQAKKTEPPSGGTAQVEE